MYIFSYLYLHDKSEGQKIVETEMTPGECLSLNSKSTDEDQQKIVPSRRLGFDGGSCGYRAKDEGIHGPQVADASVLPVNRVPVYAITEKTGEYD